MKKYNYITAPYSFKEFYSKYPQGYTIFEALLDWLDHVNAMTDQMNVTVDEWLNLKTFINDELKTYSNEQLQTWLDDGTLEQVINDALFDSKLDKSVFEDFENEYKQRFGNVKDFGAVGDGVADDTLAIQTALDTCREIFIPEGTYLTSAPLVLNSQQILKGEGRGSVITSNVPNMRLIETNQTFLRVSHINLKSTKELNQTALKVHSYESVFEDVTVWGFEIGAEISGVTISFRDCFFTHNEYGAIVVDSHLPFNTMITFESTTFLYNTLGLSNTEHGQDLRNVYNTLINRSVFERNVKHMNYTFYQCVISNSWFEAAEEQSSIRKWQLVLMNNHYNDPLDNFLFTTYPSNSGAGAYQGAFIVEKDGTIGAKSLKLQYFQPNTGEDQSQLKLTEVKNPSSPYLNTYSISRNDVRLGSIPYTDSYFQVQLGLMRISKNGNVVHNSTGLTPTVTINGTTIEIDFSQTITGSLQVQAMNPTSSATNFITTRVAFQHSTPSSYNSYMTFTKIYVQCLDETNTPVLGNVMLTLLRSE